MSNKTVPTRIIQKHDIEANWKLATNFIPLNGEIIIYDEDENYPYKRVKVGNGTTLVSNLPFTDEHLADITYVDTEIEKNKYNHPSVHSASMIVTTDNKQFASQAEKEEWNIAFDHSQSVHAPANAQRNSDITKEEIEAKLTGTIATHAHNVNGEGKVLATEPFVNEAIAQAMLEGEIDVSVFAQKTDIPTKVSQLENDMEYLPSLLGTYTKIEQYQIGLKSVIPADCKWQIGFIGEDGEVSTYFNDNYFCTISYIPVEEMLTYAMFYNQANIGAIHHAFYNNQYELVKHNKASVNIINVPEGACYFRTSILVTSVGLQKGQASVDENGYLTNPTGIFEMYQQTHTNYEGGEWFEREIMSRENFYVPFECLLDGSIGLEHVDFTVEYPPINLCDPEQLHSGYNGSTNGYGKYGANDVYVCTEPIIVSPGDCISIWVLNQNRILASPTEARFISVYDKDLNLIENVAQQRTYVVPDGGRHIMITLYLPTFDNKTELMYIQRHENMNTFQGYYKPLKPVYKIDRKAVDQLGSTEIHMCLPPEICIPAGYTIELYNNQCCLEADDYHVQWIGKYGDAYDWKYVITGDDALVGQSFTLTMNVYNDALELIKSAETTIIMVSNVINSEQLIIPIGDSLTNQKPWLNSIYTNLSNQKIKFRGTRGTTDPTLENGITHEGRSGAGSGWYNSGTSTYTFDSNGLSTLPDVTTNPFWNPTTDAFDFDYYCNSAANGGAGYFQNSNGVNISLDPTGVMIYLGANGVTMDPKTQVNNIVTLIDAIRNSIKGIDIPIYVVNTQYRAPYILLTTADGFATNSSGEFKFQNDIKYQNLMRALNAELKGKNKVYIIPVNVTHDSAHNYPYKEVDINPYNSSFKEKKYTDTIHPTISGYNQMAVTMFGSICAHYNQ